MLCKLCRPSANVIKLFSFVSSLLYPGNLKFKSKAILKIVFNGSIYNDSLFRNLRMDPLS
jgi:hypothetical protein